MATGTAVDTLHTWAVDALPRLVASASILLAAAIAWRVFSPLLGRAIGRSGVDPTLGGLLLAVVRWVLWVVAVLTAAAHLGIQLTPLLGGFGVVGLAVGLAAKDTVTNLIAGVILLWDRPFHLGDRVAIEGVEGRVERIGMRSTRLRTIDGELVVFPNSTIAETRITNRSTGAPYRVRVPVTLSAARDGPGLRRRLIETARADPGVAADPPPALQTLGMTGTSVQAELQAWVMPPADADAVRARLQDAVLAVLREDG